jgi:hypothetical protein
VVKDIFIDNNIAKNFANPLDPEYKKLIEWLIKFDDDNLPNNAHLMVSQKLLVEYISSAGAAYSATNITVIINKLTREGRLVKIDSRVIKDFQRRYFTRKVVRKLKCNRKDRDHIPVVLLSYRKYALSFDHNFSRDLVNFPGFVVRVESRPENLPYE